MRPFALNDTASISFKYLAFILRGELCVVKHSAMLGIWHFIPTYTLLFFYVRVYKVEEACVDLVISLQTTEEKYFFFRKQLQKESAMAFLTHSGRALHSYR